MESGDIKDAQITASSSLNGHEPFKARLNLVSDSKLSLHASVLREITININVCVFVKYIVLIITNTTGESLEGLWCYRETCKREY